MRNIKVRVYPSASKLKKKQQLAWKIAEIASDKSKLNEDEKKSLKILCQGAAMRFLLTRVFDYLNLTKGAIVKIKDPIEYLKRLEFHKNAKSFEDYLI